jgi:hypothetical protein
MFTERRSDPHGALRHRRAAAAQRWADATGGAAPCAVDRSGARKDAPKYHEGEVAALGEAMRIVAAAGPVDALAQVEKALADWTHRANSLSASPSADWRAYHRGGRDALQAFVDAERRDAEHH